MFALIASLAVRLCELTADLTASVTHMDFKTLANHIGSAKVDYVFVFVGVALRLSLQELFALEASSDAV